MATLAWFLAAARTMDGPPMSISSISSSTVMPGPVERSRERIQVDDHDLERCDAGVEELEPVVLEAAIGEEAGVDARMERLDPPVEHLRRPGHGGHVGHRQSRVAQGARRATGGHELEAAGDEPAAERHQPRLVRDRQQRAPRGRDRGVGPAEVQRDPTAVRLDREGAGEEPGDDLRQQPVLHGPDPVVERRGVVAGQDRPRPPGRRSGRRRGSRRRGGRCSR